MVQILAAKFKGPQTSHVKGKIYAMLKVVSSLRKLQFLSTGEADRVGVRSCRTVIGVSCCSVAATKSNKVMKKINKMSGFVTIGGICDFEWRFWRRRLYSPKGNENKITRFHFSFLSKVLTFIDIIGLDTLKHWKEAAFVLYVKWRQWRSDFHIFHTYHVIFSLYIFSYKVILLRLAVQENIKYFCVPKLQSR